MDGCCAIIPLRRTARESLKHYRYGKGDMQIHYALNAPPRWKGGDELGKVALLHVTPGLDGVSRAANECERGLLPAEPTICVGQPTALDPSRAPEGKAILWLQLPEAPRHIKGDAKGEIAAPADGSWTPEIREAYADRVEALFSRHIENFSSLVIARKVYSPADLEALNVNLVGGDPYGGYCGLDQFFLWRPYSGLDQPQHARSRPLSDRRLHASRARAWRRLRFPARQCAEMSDQTSIKGSPFEDPFWLHGGSLSLRPTLGQIGLQQFAPYLINRISLSWVTQLASALKAHDMTTTQMRALAVLSISSPVTINELSQFALTEQSTMSRTLDALEEQAFIVRKPRPEDLRVRDVEITQAGRDAFAKVWPMMYDLLLKMFEGIDNEEYKAFTATMHKMMLNIRKHGI